MKNSMTAAPVFFQILVKAHILRNASQKQGAYWISDTTTVILIQITGIEKALQNAAPKERYTERAAARNRQIKIAVMMPRMLWYGKRISNGRMIARRPIQ